MKLNFLFITLVVLSFTTSNAQEEEEKENPFSFKWDNGFKLESKDKDFKLKFGGRIMVDHAYFFQDDDLDTNFGMLESKSGTEFRRARLFMSGTIYSNVEFKLQLDFSGGKTTLKDAYMGIKKIPVVGTIRIGHIKEPFRLTALTSSKYISLMEVGPNINFSQERNNGIIIMNDILDKQLSFQAGAFRNANNDSDDVLADDGYVLTGRFTGLAINNTEKNQLLHLGAAFSFRKPDSKEYKVSIRPSSHLSLKYISTGTLEGVDNINLTNFEVALVLKSFFFQGEYLTATVNNIDVAAIDSYNFSSYYGEVSFFLTGESKKYKNSYSGFDRVKPKKNFGGKDNGAGAWELAMRYSSSDLNSKDVFGGEQSDFALGVNWYLNPSTRLMINHVWADIKDIGKASIIQGRMQIDF